MKKAVKNTGKGVRNKMRKSRTGSRFLSFLLSLSLIVGTLSGVIIFAPEKVAKAVGDVSLKIDGAAYDSSKTYDMTSSSIMLELDDESSSAYNSDVYKVTWSIVSGNDKVEFGNTGRTYAIVNALSFGSARVMVVIENADETAEQIYKSASCTLEVTFGIDTSGNQYQEINGERALVLELGESQQMSLNLGGTATWTSGDTDVVSVGSSGSSITASAIGAGRTVIRATGSVNGEAKSGQVTVYVAPGILDEGSNTYVSNLDKEMTSGGYIYTNTKFESSTMQAFDDKVYWELENQEGTVLATTNSPSGDTVQVRNPEYSVYDNRLMISGVAGKYIMRFYTVGTYSSFGDNKVGPYQLARVNLTIRSSIEDKTEIIGVGDKYNLAESYNLSQTDFNRLFPNPVIYQYVEGITDPGEYNLDCSAYATLANGVVSAKKEGEIVALMHIPDQASIRSQIMQLTGLSSLPSSGYFVTRISIVDKITLSSESMHMMVGQSQTLHVTKNSEYNGTITWTSSDNSSVQVSGSGLNATITAKKAVGQPGVAITATMSIGNGRYKTATCYVTVEESVTTFSLSPNTKQVINVGDEKIIRITGINNIDNYSELPLQWSQSSSDENISIDVDPSKKFAIIKGVKGGNTTLMVTNTVNWSVQRLEIEVTIPIESMNFTEEEYKVQYYTRGLSMSPLLEILPKDATSKDVKWTSLNTSIATFDEDNPGYLRFLMPGRVTVKAEPKSDRIGINIPTAVVNIVGTPDNIIFEDLKDDKLDIEVGDLKIINLTFEPASADTTITWSVSKAGIVRLDYDSDRRQLSVLGQGVGNAIVTARTEDNMYFTFDVTVTEASSGVSFDEKSITLIRGDDKKGTYQLTPKLTPTTSTDGVTYKSNDPSIASVNENTGLVTAQKAGTTYVIGTTTSGKSAIVDVVVRDLVTEIQQSFQDGVVYVGETLTITPTIVPSTADNMNINWTWSELSGGGAVSIESGIAVKTGSPYVEVTGVSTGVVKLLGVSAENKAATVMYVLTVKTRKPVYTTKVTLSPAIKYINVGKSFTVSKKVTGAYKGNKTLKWKSSKKSVATVTQKGKVKAKKVGKATITATAQDGSKKKGTMKVVVRRLVTSIKLNKTSANILVGKSVKLKAIIKPSNATVKGVTWKSSDSSIATVNGGKVIGQSPGMVKITATSKDYKKKKASCWVTVSENVPVTSFTVADSSLTVAKGKSVQSGISTNPANSTNSVKYWSDNKKVATVSSRGKISTHAVGQATIYARASNGVEAFVDVTVVDLNRKAVTMRQYDTEQLNVMNITTGVTWYSANPDIAKVSDSGLVTGRKAGTTTIYAVIDSVKLGCKVTVKKIT